MDAHLFRRFCDTLLPLLTGARLEKLQEPAPDMLTLTFYGAGRKRQLCLRFGRKEPFCFLTENRISAGHTPTARLMRLRKYASGRRVAACVAQYWRRRLWLLPGGPVPVEPGGMLTWLLLDMREGPSLHFLDAQAGPEAEDERWPMPAELARARRDWRQWPVLTPALRRSLEHLEEPEQWALLEDLRAGGGDVFAYRAASGIRAVSAWPLPQALRGELREESGPDVLSLLERAGQSLVLERLARDQAAKANLPLARRGRKLKRLLDKLREEESRLEGMRAARADALALRENLWRWPPELRAPAVSVPEGPHGPAREIRLDPRHTVREVMERLFHTVRRGRRGLEHLALRRAALEAEAASLARAPQAGVTESATARAQDAAAPCLREAPASAGFALPGDLPKNVQLFISDDGFVLLRGRDARGNLAARKLAAPHDIWLHADNGPGSHVIIRRAHGGQTVPERTLDQAGGLAACKSWQRDAARARILYAEVRHVKTMRNAPAGTVRVDKVFASREAPVDHELESRLLPDA
ncbi:NFACT RNA binding domain-containing protein [Desulfovibrio sp. SGI.169]|uniref:NFACT RNA binding domain-containing protein n=1 Tax=Desulfovibrio sp. SGI.169 TaxID=3420561 RepID=UPI003D02890C